MNQDPETGVGDIVARSRNIFMGYHKNKEATLSAFEDDWYKTGDTGRFDEDGFLWLMGRSKELLITSGGKNIPPVPIEEDIKKAMQAFVSQVVVIGDGKNYLTCLITLLAKVDPSGRPLEELEGSVIKWCEKLAGSDCGVKTISDFKSNKKLMLKVQ